MMPKLEVGVLGATGMVGQQFVAQLGGHPWFDLVWLGASHRSAGRSYREATAWKLPSSIPPGVANRRIEETKPGGAPQLVFSAMDASVAGEIEEAFAVAGHIVVSNSRNHRMDDVVPLLVPEINAEHLSLLSPQRESKGWTGAIVTNPNCSTVVLTLALAPLRRFGLEAVVVTTLQAISGAGYPGVPSMDILGNIVPFISGEEGKIETETQKILGTLGTNRIDPHPVAVSAHTTRVPVLNGHTEMISVKLATDPTLDDIIAAFSEFVGEPQAHGLPSAPPRPVVYMDEPDRPQPRLDVDRDRGMTVTAGRLRRCPVLGFKFAAMGHNTIRGAAGAAVLNAELMVARGLLRTRP